MNESLKNAKIFLTPFVRLSLKKEVEINLNYFKGLARFVFYALLWMVLLTGLEAIFILPAAAGMRWLSAVWILLVIGAGIFAMIKRRNHKRNKRKIEEVVEEQIKRLLAKDIGQLFLIKCSQMAGAFQRLRRVLAREPKSKSVAKSRLKLILVQDRIGVDDEVMKAVQAELTTLLSRYFELEPDGIEMGLQREKESMALVANIPITGLKSRRPIKEKQSEGT